MFSVVKKHEKSIRSFCRSYCVPLALAAVLAFPSSLMAQDTVDSLLTEIQTAFGGITLKQVALGIFGLGAGLFVIMILMRGFMLVASLAYRWATRAMRTA